MMADQPISWWITLVVIWTVAVAFVLLALAVFVPPLWGAGLAWVRGLLPDRSRVVDFNERRRQLNAAHVRRP